MKFLQGFVHAFKGIVELIKTERNFQVHLLILVGVIIAGFYFSIQPIEWILILLISAIVLGLEAMNSAIEKLCDEVTLERIPSIRIIKDMAAGAVLISAIVAAIIGVMIFWKYLGR